MKLATNLGVAAALFRSQLLVAAALLAIFPAAAILKYVSAASAILGLLLVFAGACVVMRENTSIQYALDGEIADIPELAPRAGEGARAAFEQNES